MAKEINLPGIGKVKAGYVIAGGGIVLVIVGYAYIRHRNSAAAASSSTDTSGTDTSAGIDPETGYPYGSAEDQAALAQLNGGLGDSYDNGGLGGAATQQYYYDPADGLYDLTSPYTGGTGSDSNTGPGTFTSNAYWTQYAIQNVTGYSASQIQTAIALVFAGEGLTETQLSIWQACLAVAGNPPTAPTTAPHLSNNGGGGSGGKYATDPPPGFGVSKTAKNSATFHWTKQGSPLTGYEFTLYSGATEISSQAPGASVTSLTVNGLKPGYKYVAKLRALPQSPGSDGASVSFTTPK